MSRTGYQGLSTAALRVLLGTYAKLGVFARQRAAIEHELVIRDWADWIEMHLDRMTRWMRGGLS